MWGVQERLQELHVDGRMSLGTRQVLYQCWVMWQIVKVISWPHCHLDLNWRSLSARHTWRLLHWKHVKFPPMSTTGSVVLASLLIASFKITSNCTLWGLSSAPPNHSLTVINEEHLLYGVRWNGCKVKMMILFYFYLLCFFFLLILFCQVLISYVIHWHEELIKPPCPLRDLSFNMLLWYWYLNQNKVLCLV